MRKLFYLFVFAVIVISCNNAPVAEQKKDGDAVTKEALSYPYKATYSSAFEMGDPKNAQIVLNIWKAYEDNKFEETKSFWADTAVIQFADGFTVVGPPDSMVAGGKADRGRFTTVTDTLRAWFPIKSTDKNEDWVGIWATEFRTDKKGKKDTTDLHEIWRVKAGKVTYVSQYAAHHK